MKCQRVKLSEKKDVRNNILSFLPEDDSVCDTIPKLFYTPEIHEVLSAGMAATDILLWSAHTLSFVSPDFVFHELTLTMKFYW